jgi:hypothetical protein
MPGLLFIYFEIAAHHRPDAQRRQPVCGDEVSVNPLRLIHPLKARFRTFQSPKSASEASWPNPYLQR